MPRNRSARVEPLGPERRRAAATPTLRPASPTRRRLTLAVLLVASLALLSAYFREAPRGAVHEAQSLAADALRPFQVAAERVARPFQDAGGWLGDVLAAKSENERLRAEVWRLRQRLVERTSLRRDYLWLRRQLRYREGPTFPRGYRALAARIIARTPGRFERRVTIAAGSRQGVRAHDPVVVASGLIGQVTRTAPGVAQVTLLTDETSAVSALDLSTGAAGILRHGQSSGGSLVLDRVTKDRVVRAGDVIVTAGWRAGKLSSIYPRGIPIGVVTSVGQLDTDVYKQIEVEPFVDFGSLDSVLVLLPRGRRT